MSDDEEGGGTMLVGTAVKTGVRRRDFENEADKEKILQVFSGNWGFTGFLHFELVFEL